MYKIHVRDYTTAGRFIDTFIVDCQYMTDVEDWLGMIFDASMKDQDAVVSAKIYQMLGKMGVDECLKPVDRTNVMVRDQNNELIAWSYLL